MHYDRPADRCARLTDFRRWWPAVASAMATPRAGIGWCAHHLQPGAGRAVRHSSAVPTPSAWALCNGCQMFAELADIIPGAEAWPRFTTSRASASRPPLAGGGARSPSLFLRDLAGQPRPIAVAHGEGYANFSEYRGNAEKAIAAMRFVD